MEDWAVVEAKETLKEEGQWQPRVEELEKAVDAIPEPEPRHQTWAMRALLMAVLMMGAVALVAGCYWLKRRTKETREDLAAVRWVLRFQGRQRPVEHDTV